MKHPLIGLLVLLCAGATARAQPAVVGDWEGTLRSGAAELHLALHLMAGDNGELRGTLDSIDQGALGIPATAVTLTGSRLIIRIAAVGGTYEGVVNPERTAIEGTWSQAGTAAPLVFTRGAARPAVARPQTPIKPYPYREEEVFYENAAAHITLAATLTVPAGPGPFPAVVLITGSGAQDRDESVAGHQPFLVLADHLTRRGIAVLRADDRGVGKSGGNFATATTPDLATDAEAGVAYLRTRSEVNARKIGLVGHSEGGVIAPMIAARDHSIAFIVMMAGSGVSGDDVLVEQNALIFEAMGATREAALARAGQIRALTAIVRQPTGSDADRETKMRQLLAGQAPEPQITAQIKALNTPWFRYFLGTIRPLR